MQILKYGWLKNNTHYDRQLICGWNRLTFEAKLLEQILDIRSKKKYFLHVYVRWECSKYTNYVYSSIKYFNRIIQHNYELLIATQIANFLKPIRKGFLNRTKYFPM